MIELDEDLSHYNPFFTPEKVGENSYKAGNITVEVNPENFLLRRYGGKIASGQSEVLPEIARRQYWGDEEFFGRSSRR